VHPRQHLGSEQLERAPRFVAPDRLEDEIQNARAELAVQGRDLPQHGLGAADQQLTKVDPLLQIVRLQPLALRDGVATVIPGLRDRVVQDAVAQREAGASLGAAVVPAVAGGVGVGSLTSLPLPPLALALGAPDGSSTEVPLQPASSTSMNPDKRALVTMRRYGAIQMPQPILALD